MASKFLNSFLLAEDENLRKSLYPISAHEYEHRFTKFVRHRKSQSSTNNYEIPSDNKARINFNPQAQATTDTALPFGQIIQRYHDQSFVSKPKQLSNRERFVLFWKRGISLALWQGESERIFRKDSSVLLAWNFLVLYSYIFNIFEIPIAMFFTNVVYEDEYHTVAGLVLNWISILVILFNILIVRPNTEFQKLGYLISNRREIMDNYLGIKCFLDVFGVLVLIIYAVSDTPMLIFLKLLFYVDVGTIFEIDDHIIDKIQLKPFRYATYKLARLLTYMLFTLVWLSSIFFYIDYRYYVNQTYLGYYNWLTFAMCAFHVEDGISVGTDIIQQYPGQWYVWLNYAIYWALQTISTVGYGDITPRNPVSVVFTNISILIMMFFFVFFINSVIEIIDEMTSSEEKQKKSNIKKFKLYYMNAKEKLDEISLKYSYTKEEVEQSRQELENTSNNIRSYLYEMDLNNLLQEQQNVEHLVNQSLTPELREELFINYRQLFFKKVLVFGEIAKISDDFMSVYEKLIYKIREVPYGRNEVVYARGEQRSNSLFFLLKGTLILQYPHSNYQKVLDITTEEMTGQANPLDSSFYNFGVREFFTREETDHNAITVSYCKIQRLDYEDFMAVIREYKDYYFKFCELRDVILVDRVNSFTGEECFECASKKHHLFNCDKCLFNLRFSIQEGWQSTYKVLVNEPSPAVNPRVPFYNRDRVLSSRIIRGTRWHSLPEDRVINSRVFRPNGNINLFQSRE